ncbi:unnamed protein product [Sympodiomycopsis kandeliae]
MRTSRVNAGLKRRNLIASTLGPIIADKVEHGGTESRPALAPDRCSNSTIVLSSVPIRSKSPWFQLRHFVKIDMVSTKERIMKRPLLSRGLSSPYAPLPPSDIRSLLLGFFFHFYTILIEPLLCHLALTAPGGSDATYGRKHIPHNAWEKQLVYDNPEVVARSGKVRLGGEAMRKAGSWDRATDSSFVSYTVFHHKKAYQQEKLNADVVLMHGINDYSGKLVPHGDHFAKAGFRVIIVDLPSFGRSSGLHAYLPSMRMLIEAIHAVLFDVKEYDDSDPLRESKQSDKRRKLFLEGHSMGGFTALYYSAICPPPQNDPSSKAMDQGWRPHIDGVAVAAPMIGISPESRPSIVVEYIARILRFFVGRLPLASAVRGNVSEDHRVEEEFEMDPMTYKGKLRIATGLAILEGLQDLSRITNRIKCPIAIHHGDKDRATSWKGSKEFFDRLEIPQDRKVFRLWNGYEHVMMKNVKGQSKEDDEKRDAVLHEIKQWLVDEARRD